MYKCINCDYKFETPQKMTYEDFYSIKSLFGFSYNNTLDVCPNCKDNSIEIIKQMDCIREQIGVNYPF